MKNLKLRSENNAEIIYSIGDIVTIRADIEPGSWAGISTNNSMCELSGKKYMITRVRNGIDRGSRYNNVTIYYELTHLGNTINTGWDWTYLHFKESYIMDEYEEESIPELYEGMYLYHYAHDNPKNGEQLLAKVISFDSTQIYCRYIFHNELKNGLPIEKIFDEQYGISKKYNDSNKPSISKNGRKFVGETLYVPDNDMLIERWGVSNKVKSDLKDGMLKLPDYFKDVKNKPRYITYISNKGNSTTVIAYQYTKDKLITFEQDKPKSIKYEHLLGNSPIKEEHLKTIIKNWSNITIKSIEQSVGLFGHNKRKSVMMENSNKSSKEKIRYKITNVLFNYEKEDKYYHVVEINDGTINLKFLLNDLDIKIPNIDSFIQPKDREINVGSDCKIIKDKLLPMSKGNTVKVIKVFNRYKPIKGKYDSNSVAIVVDKDNKQFECKLKQLKRV